MAAESFVVFTEHWSGMALLSREQRGDLLEALMALHGACEMPELDQATAIVLAMIRPRMEANRKKYEETVAKRKANGALGGRPSKKQTAQEKTLTLQEQPQGSENNLKDSEETIRFSEKPNGSENNPVYGSDPDYVNTTYSDPPLPPLGEPDACASDACEQREPHTDADTSAAQAVLAPEQPARKRQTRRDRKDEPPLRPEDWQAWYAMYPRHEARQAGILAWNAAVRSGVLPDLGVLLDALGWQVTANGWTPDRKQYIPLPATYLNARRWQDERPPAQVFSSQRPAPQRPYSKADEMLYVVEHNRRVAAQVLAEFEAEQNARQEQENGNTNTETGSGTQAFIPAGHGCELRQDF